MTGAGDEQDVEEFTFVKQNDIFVDIQQYMLRAIFPSSLSHSYGYQIGVASDFHPGLTIIPLLSYNLL